MIYKQIQHVLSFAMIFALCIFSPLESQCNDTQQHERNQEDTIAGDEIKAIGHGGDKDECTITVKHPQIVCAKQNVIGRYDSDTFRISAVVSGKDKAIKNCLLHLNAPNGEVVEIGDSISWTGNVQRLSGLSDSDRVTTNWSIVTNSNGCKCSSKSFTIDFVKESYEFPTTENKKETYQTGPYTVDVTYVVERDTCPVSTVRITNATANGRFIQETLDTGFDIAEEILVIIQTNFEFKVPPDGVKAGNTSKVDCPCSGKQQETPFEIIVNFDGRAAGLINEADVIPNARDKILNVTYRGKCCGS